MLLALLLLVLIGFRLAAALREDERRGRRRRRWWRRPRRGGGAAGGTGGWAADPAGPRHGGMERLLAERQRASRGAGLAGDRGRPAAVRLFRARPAGALRPGEPGGAAGRGARRRSPGGRRWWSATASAPARRPSWRCAIRRGLRALVLVDAALGKLDPPPKSGRPDRLGAGAALDRAAGHRGDDDQSRC